MKPFLALTAIFAALAVTAAAADTLAVSAPWSRPATGMGVVYLTVTNHGTTPDRLVAASSPVAAHVELHESVETKASSGSSMGTTGSMKSPGSSMGSMNSTSSMSGMTMGVESMHPVAFIPVPAHGTATLSPGGYHIMLIGLHRDLHASETFPLRLHFARAGWVTTTVHVRAM